MAIDELLAYAGVDDRYADAFGVRARVSDETKLAVLDALGYAVHDDASAARVLAEELERDAERRSAAVYVVRAGESETWPAAIQRRLAPEATPGYYDVDVGNEMARTIVAPRRAFVHDAIEERPLWGIGAQLYALRSERNWGIGDFTDLQMLAERSARNGASFLALNPLHQLDLRSPEHASPYSPLSRLFLNALYIDVVEAACVAGVTIEEVPLPSTAQSVVDYAHAARTKLRVLRTIFETNSSAEALDAFERRHPSVRTIALYEAIAEWRFETTGADAGWLNWPAEYRDSGSASVARFARERAACVRFFIWLQWVADTQLARAADAAQPMALGLYRDVAVGVGAQSADVWSDPGAFVLGLSVGAPPDPLNVLGQNWNLVPFHPRALVQRAYEPFIALLRANMRYAGMLRIDHVMGLQRLFCIPRACDNAGGAYVNYDTDALLGIVALESQRQRCTVVGEDLGTVPEGFRERLERERIYSCRVLYFERDRDSFRPPPEYAAHAVASTGTHDLLPLAGFWERADAETRRALCVALERAGCLDSQEPSDVLELLTAVYRFLGKSASRLVLAQLEDLLAQREAVNVPGTISEEPNWKRRYSIPVEAFDDCKTFSEILRVLRAERPIQAEVKS